MAQEQGQKPYKVLSIDERVRMKPGGGVERYYQHRIQTRSGTVISVDIDEADFTPEKAGPILAKRGTNADSIKNLGM